MISRLFLASLLTSALSSQEPANKELFFRNNEEACQKFGINPYFDPEIVVGPPWQIFYTWNLRMDNKCLAMTFKNATPWTVNRFWTDMSEYLQEQPIWEAATLYVTMGPANHQMLLFSDQGPAGRLQGVPNVIRDPNFVTKKNSVPLMQFQMKLIQGGRYLVMMDCLGGVVTLSARYLESPPYRAEVESVASELALGDGIAACTSTANNYEQMGNA